MIDPSRDVGQAGLHDMTPVSVFARAASLRAC
jgi:hypothetical protein